MNFGNLFVLVGPSGSGKTTIAKKIIKKFNNFFIISTYTTRKMRSDEKNKEDYFFISKSNFLKKIDENFFIEYINLNENFYGTSIKNFENLNEGKNALIILDREGFIKIKKKYKNTFGIFIDVNSEEEIKKRIFLRSDSLNLLNITERIKKANFERKKELTDPIFDFCVINDDLNVCISKIVEFLSTKIFIVVNLFFFYF